MALIGDRYQVLGYDSAEEDYFALTSYDERLAQTEAGKRLMRRTKAEMLSTIGQCMGILLAFLEGGPVTGSPLCIIAKNMSLLL